MAAAGGLLGRVLRAERRGLASSSSSSRGIIRATPHAARVRPAAGQPRRISGGLCLARRALHGERAASPAVPIAGSSTRRYFAARNVRPIAAEPGALRRAGEVPGRLDRAKPQSSYGLSALPERPGPQRSGPGGRSRDAPMAARSPAAGRAARSTLPRSSTPPCSRRWGRDTIFTRTAWSRSGKSRWPRRLYFARHETQASTAEQIMGSSAFQATDACRRVRREVIEVAAGRCGVRQAQAGGDRPVGALDPAQRSGADAEQWQELATQIEKRWEAEQDDRGTASAGAVAGASPVAAGRRRAAPGLPAPAVERRPRRSTGRVYANQLFRRAAGPALVGRA